MLGSFDEAEDHVQEVLLRAWRARDHFQGRSSPRTWLYRLATNACLDTLRHDARRAVPAPSSAPAGSGPSIAAMPWMQPYPDSLLDEMAAGQPGPDEVAVSRETISLAFLAAIQLLPPRQRAVLILRDVIGWPAAEVAELLGTSVPAVNSALQRARSTLRDQWPGGRLDWAPPAEPDAGQRRLLERFIAAHEQADPEALIALLRHDARRAAPAPSAAPAGAALAGTGPSIAVMPWMQPYPDSLLDELAAGQPGPEAVVVSRETISLAFLATIQLLPPRQRAVLILRDVIGWPAAGVAGLLDMSVPAVNSALQRARTTLRDQWPDGRLGWAPATEPDSEQRRLLERFIAAHEQADPEALIALLRHDIRLAIAPQVGEWNGRPDVGDALRDGMNALGQWRLLPIRANGQPGAAGYLRRPGQTAFSPFVLTVLRFEHGRLIDIAAFEQPSMFRAFGLPASL